MPFAIEVAIYLVFVAVSWMLIRDQDHGVCQDCGGLTRNWGEDRCDDCYRELGAGD